MYSYCVHVVEMLLKLQPMNRDGMTNEHVCWSRHRTHSQNAAFSSPSTARMLGLGVAGATVGPNGVPAAVGGRASSFAFRTVLSDGIPCRTTEVEGCRFCRTGADLGTPAAGTCPCGLTPNTPGVVARAPAGLEGKTDVAGVWLMLPGIVVDDAGT